MQISERLDVVCKDGFDMGLTPQKALPENMFVYICEVSFQIQRFGKHLNSIHKKDQVRIREIEQCVGFPTAQRGKMIYDTNPRT